MTGLFSDFHAFRNAMEDVQQPQHRLRELLVEVQKSYNSSKKSREKIRYRRESLCQMYETLKLYSEVTNSDETDGTTQISHGLQKAHDNLEQIEAKVAQYLGKLSQYKEMLVHEQAKLEQEEKLLQQVSKSYLHVLLKPTTDVYSQTLMPIKTESRVSELEELVMLMAYLQKLIKNCNKIIQDEMASMRMCEDEADSSKTYLIEEARTLCKYMIAPLTQFAANINSNIKEVCYTFL